MQTLRPYLDHFRAVNALDGLMTRSIMRGLRHITFAVGSISLLSATISTFFAPLTSYIEMMLGAALIAYGAWLVLFAVWCYHNSRYFAGLDSVIGSSGKTYRGCTYEVARTAFLNEGDLTASFVQSIVGQEILARLGIPRAEDSAFIGQPRLALSSDQLVLPTDERITMIEFADSLYDHDEAFRSFLSQHGVSAELFLEAVQMVVGHLHKIRRQERWWSRDALSRIQGIGGELAYGVAYELERYSRSLYHSTVYADLGIETSHTIPYCERVEHALARDKSANILLIGEAGVGKMDIVMQVAKRLRQGKGLHALFNAHFILLDTERLLATHPEQETLQTELISLFDQALAAGNCVIVIENMSRFISECRSIGISLPELLDTYLAAPELHVIGTDTPSAYHTQLEPLGAFVRRFEEILIETTSQSVTTSIILPLVFIEESRHGVLFTTRAVSAIVTAAERYINEGVMPDKAITLLLNVVQYAHETKVTTITEDLVYAYISTSIGIPAGPVSDTERDLLLNLESVLGKRVISQPAAVGAISRTMRRARANLEHTDKPIGSFLFLGPTGVGKTETAKALAYVFFNDEARMVRLDMSEFSGFDAVPRLIGTYEQTGVLSDQLREHPYTVLLLDEFEKAHDTAHDIFLQILDEGFFTDGRGERVNARNTIIIATSNAGSGLIIKTSAARSTTPILDQEVINYIIEKNILKPELINRFDATVVFEPLKEEARNKIASMFLSELEAKMQQEGYQMTIDRDVLPLIVKQGFDEQFGARPLARAIQDLVEDKLSRLIIDGTIQKGMPFRLSYKDLVSQSPL